ncbi:MAG: hypothetical protein NT040_10565 [Bacteroidetes bacterium]|nr:hypothetical protein [Bacteroidota bacterium]
MPSVILNFSNDFGFEETYPVLEPAQADGTIAFFRELTQTRFPESPSEQDIISVITELRRLYYTNKLSLGSIGAKLHIHMLLGYDKWNFMKWGTFNRYALFKVNYLLLLIKKLFPFDHHNFTYSFYLISLPGKEYAPFLEGIENTGFIETDDVTLKWFGEEFVEFSLKKKNISLKNFNSEDAVSGNNHVEAYLGELEAGFRSVAETILAIHGLADIPAKLSDGFRSMIRSIVTIADFEKFDPAGSFREVIADCFSVNCLKNENVRLFRFRSDTSNLSANLTFKLNLTAFIHVIAQLTPEKLQELFPRGKPYYFGYAEPDKNSFGKLDGLCRQILENIKIERLGEENLITYNEYSLKESSHIQDKAEIEKKHREHINYYKLLEPIPFFYDHDWAAKLAGSINPDAIESMEKIVFDRKEQLFSNISCESLNALQRTEKVNSVKTTFEKFKLNKKEINSTIDFDAYLLQKKENQSVILGLKEKFKKHLMKLASLNKFIIFVVLSVFLLTLMYWPVFQYYNNPVLIPAIGIFSGVVLLVSLVCWFLIRRKIRKVIKDLELVNRAMVNALDTFSEDIRKAAIDIAETFVYKTNYQELSRALEIFDEHNLKVDRWILYYDALLEIFTKYRRLMHYAAHPTQHRFDNALLDNNMGVFVDISQVFGVRKIPFTIDHAEKEVECVSFLNRIQMNT